MRGQRGSGINSWRWMPYFRGFRGRWVDGNAPAFDVEAFLARKPAQMLGVQQQRVAIARAMIKTPGVFLSNELLSDLDAKLCGHLRVEIARLHQKLRTTTIYVMHDQLEAMTLADRIVVPEGDAIGQVGLPAELDERPRTLFIADFVGIPNMSLFDVRMHETGQKTGDGAGGRLAVAAWWDPAFG